MRTHRTQTVETKRIYRIFHRSYNDHTDIAEHYVKVDEKKAAYIHRTSQNIIQKGDIHVYESIKFTIARVTLAQS